MKDHVEPSTQPPRMLVACDAFKLASETTVFQICPSHNPLHTALGLFLGIGLLGIISYDTPEREETNKQMRYIECSYVVGCGQSVVGNRALTRRLCTAIGVVVSPTPSSPPPDKPGKGLVFVGWTPTLLLFVCCVLYNYCVKCGAGCSALHCLGGG